MSSPKSNPMGESVPLQPALDGLEPKKRKRKVAQHNPAGINPVARVVLDVQAAHLGRTFDYLVDEKFSNDAQPGVRVRVRFGGKLLDGFIWERVATSITDTSLLKYIERVISPIVMINETMRADIEHLAEYFGGTRANIIRLAVPPRVARIENEEEWTRAAARAVSEGVDRLLAASGDASDADESQARVSRYLAYETRRVQEDYAQADAASSGIADSAWNQCVWDVAPGPGTWAADMAWVVVTALIAGKSAVICLPGHGAVLALAHALGRYGLHPLTSGDAGRSGRGDFAVIDSAETQESRYRSYIGLCSGALKCVVGTRAAMYAPVTGPALFAVLDDNAYQNSDGFMPYANVADVLSLRARLHHGTYLSMSLGRSPQAQFTVDTPGSKAVEVHAYPATIEAKRPWIRWMSPEEVRALGDSTASARMPHTVSSALVKAAVDGPVLVSVPTQDSSEALACAQCYRQARCQRCSGPLKVAGRRAPVCAWCATPALNWTCPFCQSTRMRVLRVGAQGTAAQLRNLFPGLPIIVSTPDQPRGAVATVENTPRVVIATPGAQPAVVGGSYRALAILDAWTSMYAQSLDSRTDTLTVWMALSSLVVPASEGGQVLLVGQCDPDIANSLVAWDPRILARKEVEDRRVTGLPPTTLAASVWGSYDAVMETLGEIGALDGDMSTVPLETGDEPSVMGPLEIPPAPTVRNRQFEGANDRVRAIVRVELSRRRELAQRLHQAAANRAIHRTPGELRFWISPKNLRER